MRVAVYDVLGKRVAVLADGVLEAGVHTAQLDAAGLANGVYVVRVETAQGVRAQRVTVVR